MSLYTQLTTTTIRQLAQNYNIGYIQSWKLLQGGAENTNHLLVTEKEAYVLTLCERKTKEEALVLAKLLQHLDEQGFESSKIISTKHKQLLSFYQEKPILLKKYIAGQIRGEFAAAIIFQIGCQMAKLHQATSPDFLPTQFSYGQQAFQQLNALQVEHPFVNWLDEAHQLIQENLHPDLPKALIHGDIFTSNVVISEENQPIIMDFEEACYYYRLFDIGMAITGICRTNGEIEQIKIQALLEGYESVSPLLTIEKNRLAIFVAYAATATAFWRFRQFRVYAPRVDLQDSYQEMQAIAEQFLRFGITSSTPET